MMGTYAGTFSLAGWVREGFLEIWRISTDSQMKAGWETMFQSMGRACAVVQRGRAGLAWRVKSEHIIVIIIVNTYIVLNVCQILF